MQASEKKEKRYCNSILDFENTNVKHIIFARAGQEYSFGKVF